MAVIANNKKKAVVVITFRDRKCTQLKKETIELTLPKKISAWMSFPTVMGNRNKKNLIVLLKTAKRCSSALAKQAAVWQRKYWECLSYENGLARTHACSWSKSAQRVKKKGLQLGYRTASCRKLTALPLVQNINLTAIYCVAQTFWLNRDGQVNSFATDCSRFWIAIEGCHECVVTWWNGQRQMTSDE